MPGCVRSPVKASTRSGRRFARPAEGIEVVGVEVIRGQETIIAVTREAHAMLCKAQEINYLSGPGKGVTADAPKGWKSETGSTLGRSGPT